tara:strand:- start:92 stop:733 length:642 start_codon:yes stop_codon:yes gene_type:complete
MKKEEIKYDPIRDTFLKGLTYISANPNNVFKISATILIVLLLLIVFSNNSVNRDLSYNEFTSITTNKYLDNQKDVSVDNFNKILSDYGKSESYNQAYVYLFNYYLENNMLDKLNSMVNDNKFDSDDDNIMASINLMMGDYFIRINNNEEAINKYKKAIKLFDIYDREAYVKIKLCMLYDNLLMDNEFNYLYDSINIDKINDFQLKSLYEQIGS